MEGDGGAMKYIGRIRPQIMVALLLLGAIGLFALDKGIVEISVGALTGVVALAKDVLQSDSGPARDDD